MIEKTRPLLERKTILSDAMETVAKRKAKHFRTIQYRYKRNDYDTVREVLLEAEKIAEKHSALLEEKKTWEAS